MRPRSRFVGEGARPRVELLPLLDVVFLVLAVFLMSLARMVRAYAIPVELPALATGEEPELGAVLLVSVDAAGRVYLAGEEGSSERVRAALAERVAADPELAVLVHAHRDARHGDVALVLDAVRAGGGARALLVAERAPPDADGGG